MDALRRWWNTDHLWHASLLGFVTLLALENAVEEYPHGDTWFGLVWLPWWSNLFLVAIWTFFAIPHIRAMWGEARDG